VKWSRLKSREVLRRMNTGHDVQVHDDITFFLSLFLHKSTMEMKWKWKWKWKWWFWMRKGLWVSTLNELNKSKRDDFACPSLVKSSTFIHQWLCGNVMFCWVMFGFWHWMLFQHTKRSTIMTLTHTCPIFYQHFLSFPNYN